MHYPAARQPSCPRGGRWAAPERGDQRSRRGELGLRTCSPATPARWRSQSCSWRPVLARVPGGGGVVQVQDHSCPHERRRVSCSPWRWLETGGRGRRGRPQGTRRFRSSVSTARGRWPCCVWTTEHTQGSFRVRGCPRCCSGCWAVAGHAVACSFPGLRKLPARAPHLSCSLGTALTGSGLIATMRGGPPRWAHHPGETHSPHRGGALDTVPVHSCASHRRGLWGGAGRPALIACLFGSPTPLGQDVDELIDLDLPNVSVPVHSKRTGGDAIRMESIDCQLSRKRMRHAIPAAHALSRTLRVWRSAHLTA